MLQLQRSKEGKDWWSYLAPKLTSEQLEGNIVYSFYYSPIHSLNIFNFLLMYILSKYNVSKVSTAH